MLKKFVDGMLILGPETEADLKLVVKLLGDESHGKIPLQDQVNHQLPSTDVPRKKKRGWGKMRQCTMCDQRKKGNRGMAIHLSKKHGIKSKKYHKELTPVISS